MADTFRTSDIVLASTIKVFGFELVSIQLDEVNPNKGHFLFETTNEHNVYDDVYQLVEQFELGNIKVDPSLFHSTVKSLTTIVRRRLNSRG